MNITTLEKANKLNQKIKELKEALNCFEWEQEYGGQSKNPRLIIEFDGGDDREQQRLPMSLSDEIVDFLKTEIKKGIDSAMSEFNAL